MNTSRRNRKPFTIEEIQQLESNPNVQRVAGKNITYCPTFKVAALQAYQRGERPVDIFREANFNINMIGRQRPKKMLLLWRKVVEQYGDTGLLEGKRGKASTGKCRVKELTIEEKLKRAEARIKLLETENELIKKLDALERKNGKKLKPVERFQMIHRTLKVHGLRQMTHYLCQMADISRSGYYRWIQCEDKRKIREEQDKQALSLIQTHFEACKKKAGALVIKMRLERLNGITMNLKKIRRLMRKFKLITSIRRVNPYRKMAKATQEHRTCPNLLERKFDQGKPEKVFLTDITYLKYGNGQYGYLSCVKDGATRQIVAHYLSNTLKLPIVERTLERLMKRLKGKVNPETIFHSDQGVHYTHPTIQAFIHEAGFKQSMSRKGNCLDNSAMETFFGHMKDELDYRDCQTIVELRAQVDEYVRFYNTERYQWTLTKMTPDEYRNHLLIA